MRDAKPPQFSRTALMYACVIGAAALTLLPSCARSDPPRTPEMIVEALIASMDPVRTRAVCIKSWTDCAEQAAQDGRPGVDMQIAFDFDSDSLTPQAQVALNVLVQALRDRRMSSTNFRIEAHTDALGTEPYNLDLSQRQAIVVRDFLVAQGIDHARLEAVGFGQSRPRMENAFDGGNERVELRAVPRTPPPPRPRPEGGRIIYDPLTFR
jgi:outer membrane protein OmpA-like peptidoglycan-associated protein